MKLKVREEGNGYNERLFSGGLRSKLHYARFHWLQREILKAGAQVDSVLEIGCFDGKTIDFLPQKPLRYCGFDANWEGGLDQARTRWQNEVNYRFNQVTLPEEMRLDFSDRFHTAITMETLEHLPEQVVEGYLQEVARHLDGYFFITIPNEKGLVFLGKWAVKQLQHQNDDRYVFSEIVNAVLGRMDRVARREHKGFDYEEMIERIQRHFEIIRVTGIPFHRLPPWLGFGIGIVARSRLHA
jgi:2-polyprenyl-3-methyl-5-hydroxy-6-metoxy-1,4-benzoquinol methylase